MGKPNACDSNLMAILNSEICLLTFSSTILALEPMKFVNSIFLSENLGKSFHGSLVVALLWACVWKLRQCSFKYTESVVANGKAVTNPI